MLLALKKVREERRAAAREAGGAEEAEEAEGAAATAPPSDAEAMTDVDATPRTHGPLPLIERVEDVFVSKNLSVSLRIAQDPSGTSFPGAGHGATVWDSSIVLSRYISRSPEIRRRLAATNAQVRGCELGCGCALAGLTAFVLGCDMILTDMEPVLPVVEMNIEKNKDAVRRALAMAMCDSSTSDAEHLTSSLRVACAPRAAVLDWNNIESASALLDETGVIEGSACERQRKRAPFDIILGADLMYDKRLAHPLAQTIAKLADPTSIILIAHEFRKQAVDEAFFSAFREFGLDCSEKVRGTGLWEDDIALFKLKVEHR